MKLSLALPFSLAAAVALADGPSPAPLLTEDEARAVAARLLGPEAKIESVRRGASPGCAEPGLRIEQYQVKAASGGRSRTVGVELHTLTCAEGDAPPPGAARREEKLVRTRTETGFSAQQVAAARADLAQRMKVADKDITVVVAQPIQWPDGSLGCPEPGKLYTQAVEKGFVIQLKAGERLFSYHGSPRRDAFLCERPVLPMGLATERQ